MNFFDKLKVTIKQKWLDYYELNHDWLIKYSSWQDTPDGGKRPQATLIKRNNPFTSRYRYRISQQN